MCFSKDNKIIRVFEIYLFVLYGNTMYVKSAFFFKTNIIVIDVVYNE